MWWTVKKLRKLANENNVIKRGSISVKIWPDNSMNRYDIDLSLANRMSVKDVVKCWNLTEKEFLDIISEKNVK